VASVKRVTDIMGEISAASTEQSSGIDQVNKAVSQMDEVTQQNAALVEEAAAAAGSLQEQAQRLAEAVAVFKINEGRVIDMPAKELAAPAAPRVASRPAAGVAPAVRAPAPRLHHAAAAAPAASRSAAPGAATASATAQAPARPERKAASSANDSGAARPARPARATPAPAPTRVRAAGGGAAAAALSDDDWESF
jgi:methyl-accepting chemotaxis protein-1 (serine sensor receptor)